ncbi:hypothetical protein LOTGIDRAFT_233078 [Lottia gigantea]|uniref:CABIT domain-containing protein n=1 Tax=Lottia gigantea TaxID=225164 RepID=V4A7B5_LOTGI|nr:hypothetical protein LOTGIDRAFT_233078 [Lottia gigantea]ESO92637.1 hypothetical protein LOTGIDRAFT_233078 [Lottia gigantea]
MGLARKLAPVTKTGDSISNVDFQWSTQSYTLKEIISKFKLPCVVQCSADSCSVLWAKFKFDLKQPLLLYAVRTVSKIYARTLKANKSGSPEFVEFGPPLVIPEDYEGWFGIASQEAPTLIRHTRVEEVAECESDFFLVATKVPVFYLNGGESTGVYSQHYVNPGQVLRKDGFLNGPLDASSQANFAAKDKHHLRCVDNKEEEFVIPFSHRGLFYEVSQTIDEKSSGVFNTAQIMDTGGSNFPLSLRHIQGDLPALNYSFTGNIQCNHIFSEQTILGCSIGLGSNVITPLEMECKSKIKFAIALNEVDLKATKEYQRAFDFCTNQSEQYAKAIKVSFTLRPETSLEELDFSLYDTGSDVEDVDAQSEFDIDWGPDSCDSKEALETLIKLKRDNTTHLVAQDVVNDSQEIPNIPVDMGTSYELENGTEQTVYKKAAEYTVSLESQGSDLADVTVDSSLFDDSYMDIPDAIQDDEEKSGDNTTSFDASVDDTLDSSENSENSNGVETAEPNRSFATESKHVISKTDSDILRLKEMEYVGNLSKTLPGRLIKEEATRTSSGVDEKNSVKKLDEDWGPAITPPVTNSQTIPIGHVETLAVGVISLDIAGETADDCDSEILGEHVEIVDLGSDLVSDHSDEDERCVVDSDKDVTGRLTSYRSLNSLDKIGPEGEIDSSEFEVPRLDVNNNSDMESEITVNDDDTSLAESEGFPNDLNSTVSESGFVLSNGINIEDDEADSDEFLEEVRSELDLDWDKSDDSHETVIRQKPVLKRLPPQVKPLRSKNSIMNMSLEEAAV